MPLSISINRSAALFLLPLLLLEWKVFSLGIRGLERRNGPQSPQISPATAPISLETLYTSISGVMSNSAITQTVQCKPTPVPVWFCGPSGTAPACKSCPTQTTTTGALSTGQACHSGFNALILVPLAPLVAGALIPPPEGLPTLSIGDDGIPTTKQSGPDPVTQTTSLGLPGPSSSSSTTTSTEATSFQASCEVPSLKAADLATPDPSTPSTAPNPTNNSPNSGQNDPAVTGLPVLPIKNGDSSYPDSAMDCGPYPNNPYFQGGFYQFGSSFSRNDGLDAIGQFCQEQIKKKTVVGKAGVHPQGDDKLTAKPAVIHTYKVPGGSGDIMIRLEADVDNKNHKIQCPAKYDLYSFTANTESSVYAQCRQFLGQAIDQCDQNGKKDADTSGKHGGTFFTNCFYWTVLLSPEGGTSQNTPRLMKKSGIADAPHVDGPDVSPPENEGRPYQKILIDAEMPKSGSGCGEARSRN